MRMESLARFTDAQWLVLDKLTASIGIEQIDQIMAQGPEVLNVRLEILMLYAKKIFGQIYDNIALA